MKLYRRPYLIYEVYFQAVQVINKYPNSKDAQAPLPAPGMYCVYLFK